MNELASAAHLGTLAGDFWTSVYRPQRAIHALLDGLSLCTQQRQTDQRQIDAAVGRNSTQPYRVEHYLPIRIERAQADRYVPNAPRFGDGSVFGAGATYGVANPVFVSYPAPPGLRDFATLSSRLTAPGLILTAGVDVWLDRRYSRLVFAVDPLDSDAIQPGPSVSPPAEITLWATDARLDRQDVYQQHGFAFGFDSAQDSVVQQAGLLPVADCIVRGTTELGVRRLLSAATGVGVALADESIETIAQDARTRWLVTDTSVHRVPAGTPVASDVLPRGAFVCDAISIDDCRHGTPPVWLQALTLDHGGTALTFENRVVPLTPYNSEGHTRFEFTLSGPTSAVRAFFETVNRRAETNGGTFRDLVASWSGVPEPTTINPLWFVLAVQLRYALVLLRIDTPLTAPLSRHLTKLREVIPPYLLPVVVVVLRAAPSGPTISAVAGTLTRSVPRVSLSMRVGTPTYRSPQSVRFCE